LEKSRKWIIREGLTGISRSGSGAPIASGWKKSLGFLTLLLASLGSSFRRTLAKRAFVAAERSFGAVAVPWGMDPAAPDSTEDWLLPQQARPPLIGELEQRVAEALATARASEAAVMSVGAAALDAAEQARHAAELAERASGAAADARREVASALAASAPPSAPAAETAPADDADSLGDFSERADRLVARLRQLQRVPLAEPAASDAADRPQSAR
jgi:hypothetical protein